MWLHIFEQTQFCSQFVEAKVAELDKGENDPAFFAHFLVILDTAHTCRFCTFCAKLKKGTTWIFGLQTFSLLSVAAQDGQNLGQSLGGSAGLHLPFEMTEPFLGFLLMQKLQNTGVEKKCCLG